MVEGWLVSSDVTAEELMKRDMGAELSVGSVNKKNAGVLSTQGPRLLGLSSLKII